MAILPIGNSRVPFALNSQFVIGSINARQSQLTQVSNQLASGKRINLPSDDPAGAVQASIIQRTIEQQQAYQSNIKQGSQSLSYVDTVLSSFTDAIDSAKATALSAVDTTKPDADYTAAADQIDAILKQLVNTANGQYLGRYALAGSDPSVQPFEWDGNYINYNGDSSILETLQASNQLFPASISADSAIGTFSSVGYGTALTPNINASTRLRDLNGGEGVSLGEIQIDTGTGSPVIVDLSQADSIQNVLDAINNDPTLSGQGLTVAINSAGNGLAVTAGPNANVTIDNVGGDGTARDLGIVFNNATIPAQGTAVTPQVNLSTPLSLLNGGAGIDTSAPFIIQNGTDSASIDLSSAVTVQDAINTINGAGIGVRAEINSDGTGINVLNTRSGSAFSIIESSQTGTLANDLGIRTTRLDTPLADLNDLAGINTISGADIKVDVADGNSYQIDLSTAKTIGDVQQLIQTATAGKVTVDVNPEGGFRLVDNTSGAGNFAVGDVNGSKTATNLGIASSTAGGGTILGSNVSKGHVKGVFDTLLRLRDALRNHDQSGIQVTGSQLDTDQARLSLARGTIGARLNTLDAISSGITTNLTSLETQNSDIVNADFTETTMQLSIQQTALQAALAAGSKLLQRSLLDYL